MQPAHSENLSMVSKEESKPTEAAGAGTGTRTDTGAALTKMDTNTARNRFSGARKQVILGVIGLVGTLGPLSSSIYNPALLQVKSDLNTSITLVNATVSVFMCMLGLAPLIWGPLSDQIGRRKVCITSISIYVAASIGCGFSPNIICLLVMRIVQSVGGSSFGAIGAASVADLFDEYERGTAMGVVYLGLYFGPVAGPILGGFLAEAYGWRSIFWFLACLGGLMLLCVILLFPETSSKDFSQIKFQPSTINPFIPLSYLLHIEVLLSTLYPALLFGLYYFTITIVPIQFPSKYNLSTGLVGLCFLGPGLGNIIGTIIGGRYTDYVSRKMTLRNDGKREPEMRLHAMWPACVMVPVGLLLFGWTLQYDVHFIVPLLGLLINAIGLTVIQTATNTYLVDIYSKQAASVIGAFNFLRLSVFATVMPLFSVQMAEGLGDGWCMTVWAALACVFVLSSIYVALAMGPRRKARQNSTQLVFSV